MQDVFYSKLQWIYGVIEVNSSCLSREWLESKEMVDDTCRWQLCMTIWEVRLLIIIGMFS